MNWFEDWFNSKYYHILYKDRDKKEAELFIDNLVDYLKIPKGNSILDIACGKGRHAIYFNKKGMHVLGVDLSEKSINIAKKNENENLKFTVHDMREKLTENKFDVVTNLFTSFGYFKTTKDDQRSINSMALNLKKGGVLVIDFMNIKKIIRQLITSEEKAVDGIRFKIERSINRKYIVKKITFSEEKKTYQFKERVKLLSLIDFSKLIANSGLRIIDIFGNYRLENFNAIYSDRLIIVCKK